MQQYPKLWFATLTRRQTNNRENLSDQWQPLHLPLSDSNLKLVWHVSEDKKTSVEFNGKRVVIVGDCRLDNRAALAQQLRVEPVVSDLQLILHAYLRWGNECVAALLGAFAFAIWDVEAQQLLCARDHMGIRPFFYYYDRHYFVFANEPKGVYRHPAVPHRPNLHKIAGLTMFSAHLLDPTASYFENIYALPSATTLLVTVNDLQTTTYWRPDPQARLKLPVSEIPEALRQLLYEAVAARLPSQEPAIALLSGGLDSSAIVAVAADLLKRQNRSLITLSAVLPPGHYPDIVDETPFIDQFQSWDNIDLIAITADQRGPFDEVQQLVEISDQPFHTSRHYLYTAFAETTRHYKAEHILDGVGGEIGPTFYGDGFYPEQLIRGRWLLLARELWWRAKRDNVPLRSVVKSYLLKPLVPIQIARFLGYDLRPFNVVQLRENHVLQPSFVDALLGDALETLEKELILMFATKLNHRQDQARNIYLGQQLFDPGSFVGSHWVTRTYPFLDKRVLEFCLAAPGELKIHNGHRRYLIRAALDGLLPEKIQWRTSKEPFSPDYHLRYNRQRPWAQQFLAAIAPNDPVCQVVNVEKLKRLADYEMQGNRGNTPADMGALHFVPMGIYLITFLRQFSDFR